MLAFAFTAIGLGFYILSKARGRSLRPVPEAPVPISNGTIWRLWPPIVFALLLLSGCTPYGPGYGPRGSPYFVANAPYFAQPQWGPPAPFTYGRLPYRGPRMPARAYGTMPIDELGPYTPIIRDLSPERPRIERGPEPEPPSAAPVDRKREILTAAPPGNANKQPEPTTSDSPKPPPEVIRDGPSNGAQAKRSPSCGPWRLGCGILWP